MPTARSGTPCPEGSCAARQGRAGLGGGEPGDAQGGPRGRRRAAVRAGLRGMRSPPPAVQLFGYQPPGAVRLAT